MNNLCRECAKPLDRVGVRCIKCNEQKNQQQVEDRKFYKSIGICPRCRIRKIYGDEKVCVECSVKLSQEVMQTRDKAEYNKRHAEWSRRTHQKMIDLGMCSRCRKRKADVGYKTCGICRAKIRESKRTKNYKPNRKDRYIQGLCYFCDNPIKPGYKVCEKHYQQNVKNSQSEKAKQSRQNLIKQGILY